MSLDKMLELGAMRAARKELAKAAASHLSACAGAISAPNADLDEAIDDARDVLTKFKAVLKDLDEEIDERQHREIRAEEATSEALAKAAEAAAK